MDNSAEIVASLASVNSGRTQNDVRQKEHERLTAFMDSPLFVLLPLAKMLLSTNTLPTSTRLYGSQCLSHYVRTRLAQSPQLRDDISGIAGVVLPALASQDLSLVSMPGNRPLVNHLSTVIADAAAIAWPTAWPSFFSDLAYLSTASITGALTAALVIPRLVEAATTPIPHVPTRVRVALASALTSAIQHEELAHQYVALSSACLSAVGQNVDALAASLPKESTPTPQLFACFNNASPILVTDLLKASVDAITALCGRATPNYLVDAGVWHVLRALFNCPAAAAGAVDAAKVAADAAARGAGTTYGREMLSLWRLVLELLNNASVSREGLGRSAQASILTQALAALKGLVKDHASRTLSPTGNATGDKEKEEVASQTVACVLSLASFPVAKVADEAAAVAAAIAGSLPAFVGGGREAATLCVQSFAALALRLLHRIPLSTGDGDDDDDDDDDTYETPEERRNTRMKTNRSHSSVIVRNLALAAPVGLLTAAYALIRDAVLAYQPFDAAPAAGKAVRWPSQGKEPTYSEEFNIAFQPFKANTTACDCDAFFAFEASSRLLSDIMTTLTSSKGLFAPTPAPSPAILAAAIAAANASAPPSAAAAAAATASAADSAAAAHRSALVQEITHPRGPLAPRSALAGEAIETLRLLYEATRQLVCYEVCAWLPKVKILTLSLPVFAAGVVAPVGLVEALMPVFLVSKRGNGSVTSPITEAQRLIAASLEAFLKRVEAPGLGADPEAVADGLGECIKAVAFGMSGDAAGQYVDPWLAATSSLRLTTGGAATDAAAAAWPTVSALETARLTILVRFGSPEVQKQVIESRVVPALSAWVSVPSNPAAATSATDAVAAGAGLLLLPALDVLGGSPHEAAATTAEISAWATCAAAAANAAAAQGAWGGAGKSLEELGVDLNSLPYAAKGAMQEARQRADRGLSGLAMALRVLCVPDPSFAAAAAEKAAAAQAAAQTAKAACERANAAVAVALSAATAASPRGPGMGGRKMVAETTPAAAAAAAEAAIAAAAAAAAEAAASGRGEFDSGKGFSTGALSGPAGGSDMPLNGIIPSVYSYVLTDCIRVLAWMLEATAPGSMGSRPSYLAVLAAPTPAHATWLLQFDALATVGTSLAAPVDRHTPLRTWSWTQRCLQSLYQILAGLHLAGNGIYAANLRCLDPIEPMFPQMSPEVISDFWLKTMIPIIHGCPKELYGPFFGTVLSSALGALARITSAAGAAAAAVASGAEIDYTSLGGFAGALARARGGGLRPPGSGAAGTGVPVGWGAIGESETDLKDALETMEAEGVTASVAKVLESILKLLLGASNSQKVYDAAVLAKVKSFNAAVYAAAPGQTISPEQAWAATAAAAPVFSPAMAAFVPTCSQSLTELIKAALTLPSAAVAQKAVALARLLSASAPALPQPHGAELADAMAEVAVVAGKRWVQRERDTFVKRVGNNLVKTNSVEDFFADDVAAMFRDLIVMHHGVGSMGVQALLQVPGMTPEVVEELTAMASNGFAVPPVEGQRGRKIERAMAPVGSGPGALEPENSRKFIVKYLKHIFTADLKRQ